MSPLDEYLEMKKEAISPGLKGTLSGAAATTGISLGLGAALAGMAPVVDKIYGAVTRSRDFKEMMEVNPDLQQVQADDPKFFNNAYNSLRRVNPTFGRDPIVAGSYMKKMMANPDAAGLTLAQSVQSPQAGGPRFQMPQAKVTTPELGPKAQVESMRAQQMVQGMGGGEQGSLF